MRRSTQRLGWAVPSRGVASRPVGALRTAPEGKPESGDFHGAGEGGGLPGGEISESDRLA